MTQPETQAGAMPAFTFERLVATLDRLEATAVNLHCALQSTACMDPRDTRITSITGQVVKDLLVMRDEAREALNAARTQPQRNASQEPQRDGGETT